MSEWTLYIIECADGSLYTGVTTDLKKRIARHNQGLASKYTRARKPVILKYTEIFNDKIPAMRREAEIKKLSRGNKLEIIYNKIKL